jgi:hypothetical protein
MRQSGPPKLQKFSTAKQRRLDALLEKNSEGTITPRERARLAQLVVEAERLMVANAKKLATFSGRNNRRGPKASVPVTVWGQAKSAER